MIDSLLFHSSLYFLLTGVLLTRLSPRVHLSGLVVCLVG